VLYQLKILTTALFSVLLLRRSLEPVKWGSLCLLVLGVSLVQLSNTQASSGGGKDNNTVGLVSVLLACCSSGFAGVYFEKVLKGSDVSVWVRNVQLAAIGIVVGLFGAYNADRAKVGRPRDPYCRLPRRVP
jgi:UDP-galactose transporter